MLHAEVGLGQSRPALHHVRGAVYSPIVIVRIGSVQRLSLLPRRLGTSDERQ